MAESYRAVVERLNRQQEADQMIYDNFVVAMDGLYEQLGPSDDYAEGVPLPDRVKALASPDISNFETGCRCDISDEQSVIDTLQAAQRARRAFGSSLCLTPQLTPSLQYDRLSRLLPPDYQASSAEGIYDEPNSILHNDAYRDLDDPYQEPGYAVPQVGAGYLGGK